MKRKCALLALALLAGCGGHGYVQVNSGWTPGGGVSSGATVNIQGRSAFGNLLGAGLLVGMMYGSESAAERPRTYSNAPPTAGRVPDLDPARRIAVQDCTRPIEDWSANLKCR